MSASHSITSATTAATTMKRRTVENSVTNSEVNKTFASNIVDKYVKLETFIQYLDQIQYKPPEQYISEASVLLHKLGVEFRGHRESYLPWVRFLDIAHIHKNKASDIDAFRRGIENIISQELANLNTKTEEEEKGNIGIDWRIAMKIIRMQTHFTPYDDLETLREGVLKALKAEINLALEHLLWKEENLFTQITKKNLISLLECYKSQEGQEKLLEAVTSGRFDKAKFGLEHTLIMGEDGGLYLLLNRLSKDQQKTLLSENIVTEEYLRDKIVKEKAEKKEGRMDDKIVLGKGGFGIVKFALSLLTSRSLPAEVVCAKKTRNFSQLSQGSFSFTPLEQVVESTLGDYFTNERASVIYSPIIFDMALIYSKNVNPEEEDLTTDHRKGYLMMEIMPQNTATRIFKEEMFQKWEYQKPYLLDVLKNTQALLESDIAMIDLKPDNTLYNTDLRKSTIIDLGGSIKVENAKELGQFDLGKYPFQSTAGYRAVEMESSTGIVDIHKSLAYTCGIIIKEITTKSDYPNPKEITAIIERLTVPLPEKRISITDAIAQIKKLGNDSYIERITFSHYISKVKDRLQNRKSAISINEDIDVTRELYIALDATSADPLKYKKLNTEDLFGKINKFLSPQSTSQVMAIFGTAGSGKSIALQLKFIDAIQAWQPGKPLPIYFNLADGTDLDQILRALNTELGTDLKIENLSGQHLYIDSFDEGLGIEHKRENLIKEYYQKIGGNSPPKILITCRSDYLYQDDNWQKWFSPPPSPALATNAANVAAKSEDRLEICYVAPLNYNGLEQKLPDMVTKYVNHYQKSHPQQHTYHTAKEYLGKIKELQVIDLIDTGFMFFLVLEVLFKLQKDESNQRRINKLDIYASYVFQYQGDQIARLLKSSNQKKKLEEILSFIHHQLRNLSYKPVEEQKKEEEVVDINTCVQELGNFIANQLHLTNQSRLDHSHNLFGAFAFDDSYLLKYQSIYQILKLLPLKIETTQSANRLRLDQEVKIGFRHDTFKNYYLLEAIQNEIKRDGKSLTLASKSIIDDRELIKMIALAIRHSPMLTRALNEAIINSKKDKSESSVIYASNSITLLVAAKHSFSGDDLSDIAVKGADLTHGIFYKTKLERADLSNTQMRNVNLFEAALNGADMRGANFEILPDIKVEAEVKSVCFSPDGKLLASASRDNTIKLWSATSGECIGKLEGHTHYVESVSFSPDGKLLVSGSSDITIKIWNVTSRECIRTLGEEHVQEIASVRFSSDGKLLVSSAYDKTIRVWSATSGKCIHTLEGHRYVCKSVSFSPDCKLIASASSDGTIMLWNATSGKCIHTLEGHNDEVRSVSFSPDGKLLASGSIDSTIKLWSPTSGECIRTFPSHGPLNSVSFSPDGKFLVSGSEDQTVRLWSATSGECLNTLQGHIGEVTSVSFSPDGKLLVSGSDDQTIKLWSTASDNIDTLQGHTNSVESVSFSPDGKLLASGSMDNTIMVWSAASGECIHTLQGHTREVTSVSFSPDGRLLVSSSDDQTIKLWNVTSGECIHTLEGHEYNVKHVSFSPDGKLLASGSQDKTIKLWSVTSGKCLHTLEGHKEEVTSVSFSPDGKLIVSAGGSWDWIIMLWNATSGELIQTLEGHTSAVRSVRFSPDGKLLVSGSWDKTIKLWSVTSGECLNTLEGHTKKVTSASFSPDGKLLVSGSWDKTIKLWSVTSGKCLNTLEGHTKKVTSASFSPDGKLLVSGSHDRTIKLWSVASGECLHTLKGHIGRVRSVSFSPDGNSLVSGSSDKTIKIFHKSHNNQTWLLKHNITAALSPLLADSASLNNTKLSTINKRIFDQYGAGVEFCGVDDTLSANTEIRKAILHIANQLCQVFLGKSLNFQQKNENRKVINIKRQNKNQSQNQNQTQNQSQNQSQSQSQNQVVEHKLREVISDKNQNQNQSQSQSQNQVVEPKLREVISDNSYVGQNPMSAQPDLVQPDIVLTETAQTNCCQMF